MDDRYKKHIKKNINELIRETSYPQLISACENTRLISNVMRARIDNLPDSSDGEKHKELFIKLTKRGPTAYDDLIKILINLKFSKAATLLDSARHDNAQYQSMHNLSTINSGPITQEYCLPQGCYPSKDKVDSTETLVPFTDKILLRKPLEVKKSKHIHYDRKVPYYPMKKKNRGVFLMVNIIDFPKSHHKKREGAEVDGQVLIHLFQELGFICFPYTNLSKQEFFDLVDKLNTSEYLAKTESFVMALMSHGEMYDDMHDRVVFNDGSIVKVKEIEDLFSNNVCGYLVDKPKVFIFPFCRGEAPDKGVKRYQADGMAFEMPVTNMATRSDMLVCYASVRGFQSMREKDEGSWYIQALCQVFAEHAHDTHLEDMLKLIGGKMNSFCSDDGYMQTPAYYNHGFNKLLFFNPGICEE